MYKTFFAWMLTIMALSGSLSAQQGFIRGTVYDESTGESLPGVSVVVQGTQTGTSTDLDGKFSISLSPGTYALNVSFISFQPLVVEDIEVKQGQVTLLDNIRLSETSFDLAEVTVTASSLRNTESALTTIKRKAPGVIDGISAANFRKIGDSDAAASMKRVPGVSVEGGRYVFIRGLGDRYAKTILNGLDIPGLDPDRNSIQMDIFPTNIIDNILVYKTFTADLPADFAGGVVDIELKDFPEQKTASISLSAGYNPQSHFNSDYLTYRGGKLDFLGFDDGTRAIPAITDIPMFAEVVGSPNGTQGQRYRSILESFNPDMAAIRQQSPGDFSLGVVLGNQMPRNKLTFGYTFSLSYKSQTEFYEDAAFGRYGLSGNPEITEMEVREYQSGDYGQRAVLISAHAGFAVKTSTSRLKINAMHLQNGESRAGLFRYEGSNKGSNFFAAQHNLEYTQRSLSNMLIDGRHTLIQDKWTLNWRISPTLSHLSDPDVRFTRFEDRGQGSWSIGTEVGFPERIWRDLQETNLSATINTSLKYKAFSRINTLDIGWSYTYKNRDYTIRNFMLNIRNIPLTGNPNEFFQAENLWPYNGSVARGTTYEAPFIPVNPNQFNATSDNHGVYIQSEMHPGNKVRAILGLRAEKFIQRYTGQDQQGNNILEKDVVLDDLHMFPSVNLIYALTDNQNLRLSFASTLARPSFKEMSYAEIYDPLTGRTFVGGMFRDADDMAGIEYWNGDLRSSRIQNFDLRWEAFQHQGHLLSVSLFHKEFENPIELVQFAVQKSSIQPRNVGKGQVTGLEIEIRQSLEKLFARAASLTFSTNLTLARSEIQLSDSEYNSKKTNARTGQLVEKTRNMAGQAPYILNAGLAYDGSGKGFLQGLEAGIYYNVQGKTLQVVGIADRPDIFAMPFHSVNINANKKFGSQNQWLAGLRLDNLLRSDRMSVFSAYRASDQVYQQISPGILIQFRVTYTF